MRADELHVARRDGLPERNTLFHGIRRDVAEFPFRAERPGLPVFGRMELVGVDRPAFAAVSSTLVRETLAIGGDIRGLVTDSVADWIAAHPRKLD